MEAPRIIRSDREASELRHLARRERDGRVAARPIASAKWPSPVFTARPQDAWFRRQGARRAEGGRSCCTRRSAASAA
jgi:hypothetical protein